MNTLQWLLDIRNIIKFDLIFDKYNSTHNKEVIIKRNKLKVLLPNIELAYCKYNEDIKERVEIALRSYFGFTSLWIEITNPGYKFNLYPEVEQEIKTEIERQISSVSYLI